MNVRKQLQSPIEGVCIGPYICECIISSGARALIHLPIENDFLCCFPKIQPSHILSSLLINVKPFSIFFICSIFIPQKYKCPNLKSRLIVITCIYVPFYFSSLEHGLSDSLHSSLNAVQECTLFVSWAILPFKSSLII